MVRTAIAKPYTVKERLSQYGGEVEQRLRGDFEVVGLAYPPYELAYVAFKDVMQLEVYGRMGADEPWRFVRRYSVLSASGKLGPKLAEGDRQVPEGVYGAEFLNANSRFHLSIRLDYPNAFDREMAKWDGRSRLGGDIMIHGSAVSVGCLAMGDEAAEDLFILAALVSKERLRVVVSPTDFRLPGRSPPAVGVSWAGELYDGIRTELGVFPLPGGVSGESHACSPLR
ncbi:MAG: L,D-transpeptidase family protein [Azovibrio sp.]